MFRFLSAGKPFNSKTNSLIHSGKDPLDSTLQVNLYNINQQNAPFLN